jgi:electron transfer flavoprotein alpha subunit
MRVLVFIEEQQGAPLEDAVAIVSHLAREGHPVSALYAASGSEILPTRVVESGATRIFFSHDPRFAAYPVETNVDLLATLCREHDLDTVVFATTVIGSDVAGQLAGVLDAGIGWGISQLTENAGTLIGRRLTLWESLAVEMEWTSDKRIVLMRPNVCSKAPTIPSKCEIISVKPGSFRGILRSGSAETSAVSGLSKAKTIVAGGRGLGKAENLSLVSDLAEALNGAVGVSLPVVEAGWAPRAMQVGQTGTIIQSDLYIACGISGQFQHKIGIERAGTIIAINSDINAPIMGFCDLAVIADLTTLLPRLTALIVGKQSGPSS